MLAHRWIRGAVPVLVGLLAFGVFLPSLWNGFAWDDLVMFPQNPHFQGLGWRELSWMWTTFHIGEYMPLTWMTYGADYVLWGLSPVGYHLTNLLLHALTALGVYFLARRLFLMHRRWSAEPEEVRVSWAAGLAALVFAVHPLRAEPVAWVSARGSILCGLFLVLTVLAYLKANAWAGTRRRRWGWFAGAVGLFSLALLSRSTSVMLPVVLLVLDVYPLGRLGGGAGRWLGPAVRHVWWEKLPFVILALPVVPLAWLARGIKDDPMWGATPNQLAEGVAVALFGLALYLRKTVLLGPLSPLYEKPTGLDPLDWPFVLSGGLVAAITVFLVVGRRRWPSGLVAWLCYVVILVPTLGVIPFGVQMAADRYTYVACLGFAMLAGAGVLALGQARHQGRIGKPVWVMSAGVALGVIVGFGVLSWNQVQIWRDSRTLWTYTVLVEPRAAVAHISLGLTFEWDGDLIRAMEHYREAVQAAPYDARAHAAVGRALVAQSRLSEAIGYLQTAVRLRPDFVKAQVGLGAALLSQGRVDEAIKHYRNASAALPGLAVIRYNLAAALASQDRLDEAVAEYRAALRLRPGFGEAQSQLDRTLRRLQASAHGREP